MASPWRVARSLDALLAQLNAMAPRRSKVSDGAIGDAAHAVVGSASDHNPWVRDGATGVVTARDFTHDPKGGLDCHQLAKWLTAHRDQRIKYVIWDRRIWSPEKGWQRYTGANPHTRHLHLSVRPQRVLYDDTRPWALRPTPTPTPAPAPKGPLMALSDAEQSELLRSIREVRDYLGANGGQGVKTADTVGYKVVDGHARVVDIQMALTRVLPILEAAAAELGKLTRDPDRP